jgi:ketosteroid isomerase-like protein
MAYKRKYRPGEAISSLDELYAADFVYWCDKITPRGWVSSWQFRMAAEALKRGIIRRAIRIQEEDHG